MTDLLAGAGPGLQAGDSPCSNPPLLAREYLRVSKDKTGKLQSPADQHGENGAHAGRNGWRLGESYAELTAVSASRWSTAVRGEFERLVSDLEARAFGAQILILWESSRGGRSVSDWVRLVDACEAAGVRIYVTTHGRVYDPANGRDRRSLLEDAVDAEYDNSKRRDAVLRTTTARAARGEPHGRVPYGYRRRYDPVTRQLVSQEAHPAEAPVIAELFSRVLAGEPLKAIARDFTARGIMTRGTRKAPPQPFTGASLRGMALSAAYAGLRTHQPGGRKSSVTRRPGSLSNAVEGTWPAIVPRETFHAVHALLTDPARRTRRPGGAKHLLSLIAACGPCRGPLTVEYRGGHRQYTCRDGSHVRHDAGDLDALALDLITRYLSRGDLAVMLRPSQGDLPELGQVRDDLLAARNELADWQQRAGRREVSAASFAVIEPGIIADIGRLKERERVLCAPAALAGWTGTREQVAAKLAGADLPALRNLARVVLSPAQLGTLLLESAGKGRSVPAAQRARLDRGTPPQR